MKVIKTLKQLINHNLTRAKFDPTRLKKGQILHFKINSYEDKVEILGGASKATGKYLFSLTFNIIIQTQKKVNQDQ